MEWYCVHATTKKEASVSQFLADTHGLEVYFPTMRVSRIIRRVRRKVDVPLFPGYLFCRFDFAQHFRAVRYAHDALGLVQRGGRPVQVDDEIVDQIKSEIGNLSVSSLFEDRLEVGKVVRVLDGPMQGMMGTVLRDLSETDRVHILMYLLNSDVRVNISRSLVALESV